MTLGPHLASPSCHPRPAAKQWGAIIIIRLVITQANVVPQNRKPWQTVLEGSFRKSLNEIRLQASRQDNSYLQPVSGQPGQLYSTWPDFWEKHNGDNGLRQDKNHWAVTVRWGCLQTTWNCYIPSWCLAMPGNSRDLWCSSGSAHCQSPTPKVCVHFPSRVYLRMTNGAPEFQQWDQGD